MQRFLSFCAWTTMLCPCVAQNVNYDDVAVIVNANSPGSVQIGNYFMAARNIPANRLITINAPVTSTIFTSEFPPIREAIEDHLIANELVDSINYIVTTLGVPVRLDNGTCDSLLQISRCSSFDTEVALLLGPYADQVLEQGSVFNPFFEPPGHFSRTEYGIYLVTRLAGPTVQDVLDLIDRSGPSIHVHPSGAMAVADMNNTDTNPGVQNFWNQFIYDVMEAVPDPGPQVVIDTTTVLLDKIANVSAYVSLTATSEPFLPNFQWSPGALAVEWMSFSGLDYDEPGPDVGYNRLSNWIGSGATIAVGAVNYTYASQWYFTRTMLDHYLDTNYHFNAAESMYGGIQRLSWIYQVVGDPKTSIVWDLSIGVPEDQGTTVPVLWPNPCKGIFRVALPRERIAQVSLIDVAGRRVTVHTRVSPAFAEVDASGCPNGLYLVEVLTNSGNRQCIRILLER